LKNTRSGGIIIEKELICMDKRPMILCAAMITLLAGCGDAPDEQVIVPEPVTVRTEAPTTAAESETEPETEPPTTTAEPTTEPKTEPPTTTAAPTDRDIPDGELVRILDYIPDAVIDLRYATTNNFTGKVIYDSDEAYLCYATVKKLMKVQEELRERGFRLIIWDPYRPHEAQEKLWEVCPDPTFVADPRNGITSHSRGNTIDLGIVYEDGSEVELPSGFDDFSALADRNYSDVSEEAAKNSQMLEDIMVKNGFYGYWGEWWHYSDVDTYELKIEN
jgi:D-alanyl-D-alanine dipeptidase